MKISISALVTVHNEEKILSSCLEKLQFCDEIVVILDKCSDKSKNIASNYTSAIYEGSWEYEGDRRNFGIEKCKSNWIIEIDADEHISYTLANEILERIRSNENYDNYHIKINNYIGDKLIKYGWGGSFGRGGVTCLFKKGTKKYGKHRVHPEIKFSGNFGPNLNNPINHYFINNVSELIIKFNTWSHLKALDLIESNKKESLKRNIRRVFSRFLKNYLKRKGYKEKEMGFLISLLAGLFPLVSYLKSKIKKNNIKL
tara:strand:+ start:102 stop:872 length:771 start_codon:yes stop_codon:yes gene_type:complete